MSPHRPAEEVKKQLCLELSRPEVEALVIAELQRRYAGWKPLPISIDFENRSTGGFCHCWWIPSTPPEGAK